MSDIAKIVVTESKKTAPIALMTRLNRLVVIVTVAAHNDDGLSEGHLHFN